MIEHTPAPWKWHWRNDIAAGSVFSEPHEGHAYAVAMCPRYQSREQWAADASLIAAAPDLIEPWQAADERDWERLFNALPDSGHGQFWKGILTKHRVALAKATGTVNGPEGANLR
jgi:hypothetical protein